MARPLAEAHEAVGDVFRPGLLAGRTAFVAGGTSGINLGIAERFSDLGARVVLISRSQERVDAAVAGLLSRGGEATGYAVDVRDYAALEAAFTGVAARFGSVDIVISGAAGNFLAAAAELSANAFKTVVDIDLLGTFNVFRASWSHLSKPGAVLIAITAGQAVTPLALQAHACAAKAGVNMLVKCLALEWGLAGVRVNAISPGPIEDTEGMRRLAPSQDEAAAYASRLALGTFGRKRDVADTAVFLASPAARYVTGSIYNCDGGVDVGDASAMRTYQK